MAARGECERIPPGLPFLRPAPGRPAPRRRDQTTIVIYLSLFLLLLVFFASLNAQSRVRSERMTAALGGVEDQFGRGRPAPGPQGGPLGDRIAGGTGTGGRGDDGETDAAGVAGLRRIGDLFVTALGLEKVETVARPEGADKGVVEVHVPAETLFFPGTARIRPARYGLLDRVADALRRPPAGVRYDVEAWLSLSGAAGAGAGAAPIPRLAALARHLVGLGVPESLVAIGVEGGETGRLRLVFSVRSAPLDRTGTGRGTPKA